MRLLANALGRHGSCPEPNERWNYTGTVPLSILRVKPADDYVVQELGTHLPGTIRRLCSMLRPQIGIVMNVGSDHYAQFRGEDAIADEKADLVRYLPAGGVAVLNADDERVAAMGAESKARVVTFGIANEADYRASDVTAAWPETLGFVLVHNGERHRVTTMFHGIHMAPNVLAALAAADVAGMPLKEAIAAIGEVLPVDGRMSETKAPGNVTFIRDDYKAPWWALPLTIDFISEARAKRKVLVLGEMSDNPGNKGRKFRRIINSALGSVDVVIIAGPASDQLNESLRNDSRVEVFQTVREANDFLSGYLQSEDLVVLKGMLADHLERLASSRGEGGVECWRSRCGRNIQCSACDLREAPAGVEDPVPSK